MGKAAAKKKKQSPQSAELARLKKERKRNRARLASQERELAQTLEQQAATSAILQVIANSPTNLQAVLDTVIADAVNLAGAAQGHIRQLDGEFLRIVAQYNENAEVIEILKSAPIRPVPDSFAGSALLERRPIQVTDAQLDPARHRLAQRTGARTLLAVPLLRDGTGVGTITIWRDHVEAFTEQQIQLVRTFADQAVIAIENVRLYQELETRNRELTEALQQQTAMGEVLKVIARSPVDLRPVYHKILANVTRLCEANIAALFLSDGESLSTAASHGTTVEFAEHLRRSRPRPSHETTTRLAALERQTIHVADLLSDPAFSPKPRELYEKENVRTVLSVPMLRDGNLIGVITTWRREVRPFNDKQIDLVKTFADQAVIAVENVRLLQDLEARTREREIASRHKSEFLANMSHELRTPLNAIIGFSEVLLDPALTVTEEERQQFLTDILNGGKHLLGLINEVLDLSKIEAGKMELHKEPMSLQEITQKALSTIRPLAAAKSITLEVEFSSGFPPICADAARLRQVLVNLLGNAVKFTPPQGRVWLKADRTPTDARVEVGDTGSGIAAHDHERIFLEFQQAGSGARKPEGHGPRIDAGETFRGDARRQIMGGERDRPGQPVLFQLAAFLSSRSLHRARRGRHGSSKNTIG